MSKKGDQTRQRIIEKALQVFSVKGYFNTSVSDLLDVTGLTKGGLYCHFKSKEDIWYAVYDEAVAIWRQAVFKKVEGIRDPLERIGHIVDRALKDYLGGDLFEGGCFFVNMLVELSDQSSSMSRHILKGFVDFSRLFQMWLLEASQRGLIPPHTPHREVADFIVVALNGAATLYVSSRDSAVLEETRNQLHFYIDCLRA